MEYTYTVAKMAKEKQWQDVRLLSFDLQTVEFAYALVRSSSLLQYCDRTYIIYLP